MPKKPPAKEQVEVQQEFPWRRKGNRAIQSRFKPDPLETMFLVVKAIARAKKLTEREAAAAPPPAPSNEVLLLAEIRDLLKQKA